MKRNGKRIFLCLTILLAAALCCATLVACNIDDVKEITVTPDTINVRIGEFDYADYTVTATYGSGKTEESVLTEDMIAPKDRLKFFVEGEYDIDVTYLRTTTTIKVNVRRNVFAGAEFNDLDVVYNGEFYTVEVKNVPEGTTVTYPTTNRFRTAGEYQATAILRKDAYEMKEMTAKVTIRKADYDLSDVTFENQSVEYDGTAHVLEMTGAMPMGLYVDYTITREGGREEKGNSATNAGSYIVEAKFTGDTVNFNEVDPQQATLNIRQATIDVSGLTFEDKTVVYDRTKQSIEVEGTLPRGVNVTYRNNEHVDAGTYEATAVFSVDDTVNYAAIDSMKAKLIIEKADYDMSAVHFNGTKVTYDGTEKKIEVQGQLPTGISVSYEGNEGTDAGTYEATATFTSNNVNYNNPESMTATLIIDPAIAQMDQIVFERRRFISIVAEKYHDYDNDEFDSYDPYLVANEYRPDNVPVGFAMTIEYKKTNNWQADLTSATDEGPYIDRITEDGYYVVKVTFDGGKNYVDEKPTVKTVIRVDTLDNDDISTWEQLVFDDLWVNPETGNTTGVFMDYYSGLCTDDAHRKTVTIGNVTLEYCDCNVFLNYAQKGEDALITDALENSYVSKAKREDYREFMKIFLELLQEADPDLGFSNLTTENIVRWRCSELYERHISGYNETQVNIKYDDCNPFGMIAGDFGEITSLSKHITKTASDSTIAAFNSLSELFAAFMANFEIPTDGTEYIPSIGSDALDAYTLFYNAAIELYNGSLVSFTQNISNNLSRSAVIGINHPYTMAFGTDVSPELINFQTVIANLFGFDDKDEFMTYAQALADLYAQYRTDVANSTAVNEALENGCFYTTNGSFVFPIAVKNELSSTVLAYVILDASGFVSVWVNDITAALSATCFDEEHSTAGGVTNELYCKNILFVTGPITIHIKSDDSNPFAVVRGDEVSGNATMPSEEWWCSDLYERQISGYDETVVKIKYDDCNPFGMIAGDFGDIASLTKHTTKTASDSTIAAFDTLGGLFAVFLSSKKSADYKQFYNQAIKIYNDHALVSFAKKVTNGAESKSAIIGINNDLLQIGLEVPADIDYVTLMANLFGFGDKDTFIGYANGLVSAYTTYCNTEEAQRVKALENGCFYKKTKTNDTFIFPVAVKNELDSTVLIYVMVDITETSGNVYVWVNDITAALWATNFNASYHTDGIIDNELYCKKLLFVNLTAAVNNLGETFAAVDFSAKDKDGNPEGYGAFFDAVKDLFDLSFLPYSGYTDYKYNAVIGINFQFEKLFLDKDYISELQRSKYLADVDYVEAMANMFGFSDKDEFIVHANMLVDWCKEYRSGRDELDSVVPTALEKGGFLAENGYFLFPFVIKNEYSLDVYAYVIVDNDDHVYVWVNDVENAFATTCYRFNTYIRENVLYGKHLLFETPAFVRFLSQAKKTSETAEGYSYEFDIIKAAYVPLNGGDVDTNYDVGSVENYREKLELALANIFGFEDKDRFLEVVEDVFDTYCDEEFRTGTANVSDNPLAAKGAVYVKDGESNNYAFILPYALFFTENETECIFLFCAVIDGVRRYGALLSDAGKLFDFFENATPEDPILLEGRCLTTELWMTEDGIVFRLSQKTKVVVENGVNVEKPITNGKDFVFVNKNGSTEHLVYGDVEIYRFLTELPGSCAEESAGYDPDEYKITTDTTVYTFCDDDVFATVIKANGDATGITKRNAREDHPQMTSDVAEKFDVLSELYQTFIDNYVTGEDVVNEWKIGATNRNYAAYRAFFEYAAAMMAKSNRNMGKSSDYVLSKSVIIGMNRAFSIAINSSGYNYTVDQYRLMVAKLFGFTDLDTFKQYTDEIADVLVANGKYASVDTVSARLLYDGAVLTENGYFVLPYAIKSELTSNKVMAFIFVDQSGAMSIWINDAKNAFNATSFGETAWETSDKYTVEIFGRCLMFEDDGYIMNEDLSQNVVDMIDKLQAYPEYVFRVGGAPENCNETNSEAEYHTYQYDLAGRCSSEEWFSFIYGCDGNHVSIWCDECNPFCMLYSGWIFDDVDAVKEHSLYPVPENIISDFDSLSEYFAAVMSRVEIPTGVTQTVLNISSDALNRYVTFYAKAMEIYDGSLLAFTRDVGMNFEESAVIGLDHPYVMTFGTTIDPANVDYQLVAAHLFGVDDKDEFMSYVAQLAVLYADYREGIVTNKALENGCFFTANESFVFPIAIQNELPSTVLAYLILDADGHVSLWINDIDAALWATSYDEDHLPDDEISLRDDMYCKNMLFAKEINYNAIFMFCDDDVLLTVQKANGEASEITKRVDRSDIGLISDEVAAKFDTLSVLYADLLSHYVLSDADNNWLVAEGGANYAEYRRLFRYARDLFISANNDLGKVDEYFLSGSAIVGMNEAFAISFAGTDYSMDEYRLMLTKLFGFNDVQSFTKCVDALASALAENEAGASVATIADRLLYDGAVRTTNGYFVLPYLINNYTAGKTVLAFVFVDGEGTMAVWINNVNDAFAMTDFTIKESENDIPVYLYVSGRCVLFENNNEYVGWNANGMAKYIAVEKVMAFASEGDFLIYSPFTDEEGFEVYWFSVYGFEMEVIYDDSDTANIGTVNKGFYTMVNVANIEEVHAYNQYVINTYEANLE